MANEDFDENGLSQAGAKKLLAYVRKHPEVNKRLVGEDVSDLKNKNLHRTELFRDEAVKIFDLPQGQSAEQIFDLMHNVAEAHSQYGSDTIEINVKKIQLLARGFPLPVNGLVHR